MSLALEKIVCVFAFVVINFLGSCNPPQEIKKGASKPNIVIVLSDDQGNADASYQRNPPIVSTPSIDKLAFDGVVFTNGYASGYVCAPTRAGLLTGRYQQRFGFNSPGTSTEGQAFFLMMEGAF